MNERVARENGEIEQLAGQKPITRHAPGFAGHVKIEKKVCGLSPFFKFHYFHLLFERSHVLTRKLKFHFEFYTHIFPSTQ